ncbi:MAG TPA: ribonuclease P protein component, partial [Prosthecobacter sp.]|nr:ribonuclease P protein component [Prosthecobacter sp.]
GYAMRLPSRLRLKESRDFAQMRAQGVSQAGRFLVLAVLRQEGLPEFKFGIVTGKRLGSAVVRNRLRRQLREVVRAHRAEITSGCHFVIIPRWRAAGAGLTELENDWLRLARRQGLLLKPAPPSP